MPDLACPVCGNRAAADDSNAYPRRGALFGRPVVACGACGSFLCVGRGFRGPRATRIDTDLWSQLEEEPEAVAAPAGPTLETLQGIYANVAEALNRVAAVPAYRRDARLGALHDELASALVLSHELVRERSVETPPQP